MTRNNSKNSFKNFGKNNSIQITTKISQKEIKKQKKNLSKQDSNITLGITDNEFDEMMKENELEQLVTKNNYCIPVKFKTDEVNTILSNGYLGEQLTYWFENEQIQITGLDLLNGLFEKYNDPVNINWINPNEYGLLLKYLFENKMSEQLICLLMLQNFSKLYGFIKISYKNKQVYHVRILFQLFFTYEIIDESVYWKWQDYLDNMQEIDDNTKTSLAIQTCEFFMILKTIFEQDNDDEENNNNDQYIPVNSNRLNNLNNENNKNNKDDEEDDEDKNLESDKYNIPIEQDFNLDDL